MLTYQKLQWFTILLAPLIIGSFEFFRHGFLLKYISMEVGNYYTAWDGMEATRQHFSLERKEKTSSKEPRTFVSLFMKQREW